MLLELSRCGVAFFEAFVRSWAVTLTREVTKNGYPRFISLILISMRI